MPPKKAAHATVDDANADRSDDDDASASVPGTSTSQSKTQRIAKACDRCRKSKSKCEPAPAENQPCRACAATGAACTYTAPTFRRGPPKGYIQALEHRLHQVESVLAAIMAAGDGDARCQAVVEEIGQDALGAYILDAVDAGPFGRTGREKQAIDTSKDNFFASIVSEQPRALSHRSRRQSRTTREHVIESVISSDPQVQTTRPTLAWQDRLSARLMGEHSAAQGQGQSASRSPPPARPQHSRTDSEPPRTRRRLGARPHAHAAFFPAGEDAADDGGDEGDCADAFGNLSIDENREVRYHGNSSGLQLLRVAAAEQGATGIWTFPFLGGGIWPGVRARARDPDGARAQESRAHEVERAMLLPPIEVQDQLVRVFFTYVNPAVPVLDEASFMGQYNAQYRDPEEEERTRLGSAVRPERPQRLTKLLLLAVFAYAASHLDPLQKGVGGLEDAAGVYAHRARMILDTVYHESPSSTVQALVLLGMREFGIGSLEDGWLHIGMAIRMALDLGLNRNPDRWTHDGRELFTASEKAVRKRIWWACCLADKFSALFLGRTIGIHEGDFSTPLLDVPPDEADQMWHPCAPDPLYGHLPPVPGAYVSYFRHISALYVIAGEVLANVYRVSRTSGSPSRALRSDLYRRLLQWAVDLPDALAYSPSGPAARPCPAPHILAMHIQYWAIVLLTHRPFIPKGSELAAWVGSPSPDPDPVPWESYDICQGAANQISSFALLYHEKYDMRWAPPFLVNCLQAAGVMHVVTLRYRPHDPQASVGLQKCIEALQGMEATWATALRVRHLVQNARVQPRASSESASVSDAASSPTTHSAYRERDKRPAHVAFEYESLYHQHPPQHSHSHPPQHAHAPQHAQHAPAEPASSISAAVAVSAPHRALYEPPLPPILPPLPSPLPLEPPHLYHGYTHTHARSSGLRAEAGPASLSGYVPGYEGWWPTFDAPPDPDHDHDHDHDAEADAGPGVPPRAPGAVRAGLEGPAHPHPHSHPHSGDMHHAHTHGADGVGAHPHPHAHAHPHGHGEAHAHPHAHAPGGLPSQEFTFGPQHLSPAFLQAMGNPVLHFPSAYTHPF